jgi:predicted RNase H-like HicB family nuclease
VEKFMQVTNTLEFSAVVWREDGLYVALCPEFDVASQGKSVEEALRNLKEALALYLEDEDVEKPSQAEAPIVTIVKVDVGGSTRSLRAKILGYEPKTCMRTGLNKTCEWFMENWEYIKNSVASNGEAA